MAPTEHSTGIAFERKQLQGRKFFSSPRERIVVLCFLLTAITLVAYVPLKENGFVNYDDDRYVTDNLQVKAGLSWSNVGWAFRATDASNWHPLTWISHMADVQWFGMNPAGHHLTSLCFHVANVCLLFLALYFGTGSLGRSFILAGIFAVHPLNVQSVAWVAERKNVLSTVFWLLAILAYGWYARSPTWKRYGAVLVCFALGLMAKPMVITLPVVLLLLDYWPLRRVAGLSSSSGGTAVPSAAQRTWRWLIAEKIPLLILSMASAAITIFAQRAGTSFVSGTVLPVWSRPKKAAVSYLIYIFKLFWPSRLAVYYPHPQHLAWWQVAGAFFILLVMSFAAFALKKRGYFLVGWLYFLVTLTPVIGIIQIGDEVAADRYMYLPMTGLLLLLVWGAADLFGKRQKALLTVGTGVIVVLTVVTHQQVTYWHDSIALFSHALEVTENNLIAHSNLGQALAEAGQPAAALMHYQAALMIDPNDPLNNYNVATHLQQEGSREGAIEHYQAVLASTHVAWLRAHAHNNLAMLLDEEGDQDAAQLHYQEAIRLWPQEMKPYFNLGLLLEKRGELDQAAAVYSRSIQVTPTPAGYFFLGRVLERQHRYQEAATAYEQALRLAPDFSDARQRLDAVQSGKAGARK